MNTTVLKVIKKRAEKGFTLIELLVVIGILGVLAAALLATLDPLEQIRKGQDSNRQGVAVEFAQGMNRYYANKTMFPWQTTPAACSTPGAIEDVKWVSGNCTDALVATGELKTTFEQLPSIVADDPNHKVQWVYDSTNELVRACFQPASKAQKAVADKNTDGSACAPGNGNPNNCYICFQ